MIKTIIRNFTNYFLKGNKGLDDFKTYALNHVDPLQVDGFFHKYDAENLEKYFELIMHKLDSIITKGDVVIEVGCGTGRYLKHIETTFSTGVKLYGLDAIEETLTNVTKKNVSTNVVFIADDFLKTNTLQKGQFNVLFSISVLQYIPFFKLNAFFNKMKEVLKKDGTGYLIFAPKKNKLPNFVNSLLDFGFTNYDPELVVKKLKKRFTIIEHQYIQVDGKNFGYYILFKN